MYIEYPKTSSKFSKAITRVENFSEVSGAAKKSNILYILKQKKWTIFGWTKCKNNETMSFKGHANPYNVESFNYFSL